MANHYDGRTYLDVDAAGDGGTSTLQDGLATLNAQATPYGTVLGSLADKTPADWYAAGAGSVVGTTCTARCV